MKSILWGICVVISVLAGCQNKMSNSKDLLSEITCPKCGHMKTEIMPTEVCVIRYTCEGCKEELTPKGTDCCVFCSYGSKPCPSKHG